MKITRKNAIAMFEELGFKTASKWNAERLQKRLQQLPDNIEEGTELETANDTLQAVLEAHTNEEEIEVTDDGAEKPARKAPAKKAKRSKKVAEPDDTEDEPAEEEKPSKRSKKAKPAATRASKSDDTPNRPAPGSKTGLVWDMADKLFKKSKGKMTRKEVIAACVEAGANKSTAAIQFGRWAQSTGWTAK